MLVGASRGGLVGSCWGQLAAGLQELCKAGQAGVDIVQGSPASLHGGMCEQQRRQQQQEWSAVMAQGSTVAEESYQSELRGRVRAFLRLHM